MTKCLRGAVCLVMALVVPAQAQAPAVPQVLEFAPQGQIPQEWTAPLPCRTGQLSALVSLRNPQKPSPRGATAAIALTNKGEAAQFMVRLTQLQPGALQAHEAHIVGRQRIFRQGYQGQVASSGAMHVNLAWQDAQMMALTVEGKRLDSFRVQQPVTHLRFMGVGAHVKFDRITLECGLLS